MSDIYTDPPQSRNEAIVRATIDGTQYTDPPQSRMEDLLLELKETIEGGGGGGTTVVANPEGEATDELEKLQVGSDIYEIPKDYAELDNKPQINGETLEGNKTASELGLQAELDGAKTVEGNPLTIADAEPMNAESVVVELEPKQDLHGYDAPWVGGSGKNKLPLVLADIKAANTSGTWSGNVYTNNGITYTFLVDNANNITGLNISGTATNDGAGFDLVKNASYPLNGTYIISGGDGFNDGVVAYDIKFVDSSYNTLVYSSDVEKAISSNLTQYGIFIWPRTTVNKTIYPMIRLSTETDPTFEPYSNICPITGYSEVNVERVGKNWLTDSGYVQGVLTWDDDTSLAISSLQDFITSPHIPINENTEYTIKSYVGNIVRLYVTDENYNKISFVGNSPSQGDSVRIPPTANAKFLRISIGIDGQTVTPSDYGTKVYGQLELGNQATTYEPYQGDTYTIDLDGTKYGGTLDVTEGGYSDEWGYISGSSVSDLTSLGALTTSIGSGLFGIYFPNFSAPHDSSVLTPITDLICNELPNVIPSVQWEANANGISINNQGHIIFTVKDITTQADMDTWLSNNPIQIAYRKKTPSSVSSTPTDIPLLENTNNISTDGTNITLKYQPDNVIGECKQYTDEKCSEVLPPLPTTDGTYHLSCEVTSGVGVLSWVSDS